MTGDELTERIRALEAERMRPIPHPPAWWANRDPPTKPTRANRARRAQARRARRVDDLGHRSDETDDE